MNQDFETHPLGLILSVRHKTVFYYLTAVRNSVNTLHLEPRDFLFQQTLSAFIKVIPATRLKRVDDCFGNVAHHFEIMREHQYMQVESLLKIRTLPLVLTDRDYSQTEECYSDLSPHEYGSQYLLPSRRVSRNSEVLKQAMDLCVGQKSVFEKADAIMRWIHSEFTYRTGVTRAETHLEDAFQLRAGVCQDFTHVMIGMCRSMRLPARYVSGYLYTGGRETLQGAQASHAWCEVYLPESGWIGFDPTNAVIADQRYVKIAVGRDYEDVAPILGYYFGGSTCHVEVEVSVGRF